MLLVKFENNAEFKFKVLFFVQLPKTFNTHCESKNLSLVCKSLQTSFFLSLFIRRKTKNEIFCMCDALLLLDEVVGHVF